MDRPCSRGKMVRHLTYSDRTLVIVITIHLEIMHILQHEDVDVRLRAIQALTPAVAKQLPAGEKTIICLCVYASWHILDGSIHLSEHTLLWLRSSSHVSAVGPGTRSFFVPLCNGP